MQTMPDNEENQATTQVELLRSADDTLRPIKDATFPIDRKVLERMFDILRENKGVGLAAPQVGIYECFFIVEAKPGSTYVIANPMYRPMKNKQVKRAVQIVGGEGCLSLPGYEFQLSRWSDIELLGFDAEGKPFQYFCGGLFARIVQHEVDHLRGRLINGQTLEAVEKSGQEEKK